MFDDQKNNIDNDVFNEDDLSQNENNDKINEEISEVSSSKGKGIVFIAIASLILLYIFYRILFSSDKTKDLSDNNKDLAVNERDINQPIRDSDVNIPSLPSLDNLSNRIGKISDLSTKGKEQNKNAIKKLPPLPPALPAKDISNSTTSTQDKITHLNPITSIHPNHHDDAHQQAIERQKNKMKSSIMLLSGIEQKSKEKIAEDNHFSFIGDLNRALIRGKIIDAVIESAVSTDTGAEIRAVVTKNIYSEQGGNILIPSGSRIYGIYDLSFDNMLAKVNIAWNRVNLPGGYILNLSGTGIDNLGRKGADGKIDLKMKEQLMNSVLMSTVNIAIAKGLDKIVTPVQNSQQTALIQTESTNIKNTANSIFTSSSIQTPEEKIARICSSVKAIITDKSSSSFTNINQECNNITSSTDTPETKLISLISFVNNVADNLIINSTSSSI
ncbi:MAG TPA: TrbI/VirB10 family protein [Candidatus Megaira endosymbiont of Hartmannula sinica]|nr:TrbI/VirB10 family protein [Candidatus Megaera endosymbiont of Hartmannula sinica]